MILLRNMSFDISEFEGCCGADILSRLMAEESTVHSATVGKDELRKFFATHEHAAYDSHEYFWKNLWDMLKNMAISSDMPRLPLEVGFALTAADLTQNQIHVACDVMTARRSDRHEGRYTTRSFVQWLVDNDICDVYDGVPHRDIQMWTWVTPKDWTESRNKVLRPIIDKWFKDIMPGNDDGEEIYFDRGWW